MDKTFKNFSDVSAGVMNDTTEHDEAIPAGKKWVLQQFSAGDINYGNNKSSGYIIRFGNEILRFFVYTGSSDKVNLAIEVVGDGVKKINVIRRNYDTVNKPLPFVLEMYERL